MHPGRQTWKFPCINSGIFEFVSYAKSAGASTQGGAVTLTAYHQNLAVPGARAQRQRQTPACVVALTIAESVRARAGFPQAMTSHGPAKQPWKNSLVLPAGANTTAYVQSLNLPPLSNGQAITASLYQFGVATTINASVPWSTGEGIVMSTHTRSRRSASTATTSSRRATSRPTARRAW